MPSDGAGASSSLRSSSLTRSRETMSIDGASSTAAASARRVEREPELGGEAGRPHHAQRVVAERDLGRAGRAQHAGEQVLDAAGRVDEHAARAGAAPSR